VLKNIALSVSMSLLASTVHAQWNFDNSPGRVFDMKQNLTNRTQLVISYVKASEIQAACDAQSRKFGFNGFPKGALACTWYQQDRCTMILPEKVDMRMAGHEFLHCLQGNWHQE
jgi:hypothetical protein